MKKVALGAGAVIVLVLLLGGGFVGYKISAANFDYSNTPYPKIAASTDADVIERGAYIVHNVAHCSTCHAPTDGPLDLATFKLDRSAPLTGGYTMKAGPFGTFYAQNLTPHKTTGIGRYTDEELARMIRNGVGADGRFLPIMRLAQGPMSDEDLVAVISYLRTQTPVEKSVPVDEFGPVAKIFSDKFSPREGAAPKHVAPTSEPDVVRGEYLSRGPAFCSGCHSPIDLIEGSAGPEFSGGLNGNPDPTDDAYEIIAPNLTDDPTGIVGQWDEEVFVQRMKRGRVVMGSPMPWEAYGQMTDADVRSIYRFLKTVTPVSRDVGNTRRKM